MPTLTPLMYAARLNQYDVIKVRDFMPTLTPLMYAARLNHYDVIKVRDFMSTLTPLMCVARLNHYNVIKVRDFMPTLTPLMCVARLNHYDDVIKVRDFMPTLTLQMCVARLSPYDVIKVRVFMPTLTTLNIPSSLSLAAHAGAHEIQIMHAFPQKYSRTSSRFNRLGPVRKSHTGSSSDTTLIIVHVGRNSVMCPLATNCHLDILWNALPRSIREANSLTVLKKMLKSNFYPKLLTCFLFIFYFCFPP